MKAQGLARIGKDAEVRYTQNNDAVVGLSLAFSYGKKDQQTGKRPTQWVDASFWGKRAETLAPYLRKGTQIVAYLEDIHLQTFTKQDGTQSTKLAAKVSDVELISNGQQEQQYQQPAPQQRPAPQPQRQPQAQQQHGSVFDDSDGDIPF